MLDIVEKVLTLQRIWENKQFPAIRKMRNHEDDKEAGFLFHSLHL